MNKDELIALQQNVTLLRAEGKYRETIEQGQLLLDEGFLADDHRSILTAYINITVSYYCLGDISEAFNTMDLFLEQVTEHGDDADQLNGFNVMFLLYEHNKDYEKAKETLRKTISLGQELGHFNIVSNAYSNYSHLCITVGDFQTALDKALKGLDTAKQHEPYTPILLFRVQLNVASSYIGLRQFEKAEQVIEEMNRLPLHSFPREQAQFLDLKGRFLTAIGRHEDALHAYSESVEAAKELGDTKLLKDVQEKRMELCQLTGDVELGYKVQTEYIKLLQDIREHEIAMTVARMEVKHSLAEMERKVHLDYLTGLYNRRYMETVADEWMDKAKESRENIICIALDLDNLKLINDTYGHLIGDDVIRKMADACKSRLRSTDLMGRFGGDEFVIFLRRMTLEDGRKKAQQLNGAIRELCIEADGRHLPITCSIGIADNRHGEIATFEELFHEADMALYQAKQAGKNRIELADNLESGLFDINSTVSSTISSKQER